MEVLRLEFCSPCPSDQSRHGDAVHGVDDRTRSKWSRAVQHAAEHEDPDEPLRDFMRDAVLCPEHARMCFWTRRSSTDRGGGKRRGVTLALCEALLLAMQRRGDTGSNI